MLTAAIILFTLALISLIVCFVVEDPLFGLLGIILLFISLLCAPVNEAPVKQTIRTADSIYLLEDGKLKETLSIHGTTNKRDYELEVTMDSLILYDDTRRVGSVPFKHSEFDSLILKDNY